MDPEVLERLERFRFSDREEREVEIDESDTRSSMKVCKKSLVGRIVGRKCS